MKNQSLLDPIAHLGARTLYALGIKRIRGLQFGKCGYFLTALMIALAAQSCTAGTSGNHRDAVTPDPDENAEGDPIRIQKLNAIKGWLEFKAIWKNLDAIEPAEGSGEEPILFYYSGNPGPDPYRQADSITKLIAGLEPELYRIASEGLLDEAEVRLLVETAKARVEYIFMGYRSMVMRMMPPPGQVRREGAIADLEKRIDDLLKLKKLGKIEDDELTPALNNINTEVSTFGLLEILTKNVRASHNDELFFMTLTNKDTTDLVQITIDEFENDRAEFMKSYKPEKADETDREIYQAYERTHRELIDFKAIVPGYGELIKDLSFND